MFGGEPRSHLADVILPFALGETLTPEFAAGAELCQSLEARARVLEQAILLMPGRERRKLAIDGAQLVFELAEMLLGLVDLGTQCLLRRVH